jgi:hypothetical protein
LKYNEILPPRKIEGAITRSAVKKPLISSGMGKLIGWGEGKGAEAVQQTVDATKNLTKAQSRKWEKQGLIKVWVEGS